MAQLYSAFLNRNDVPTRQALQDALNGLKFKLAVDDTYAPFETAGYLPCTLNGEDGGVDLRFDAVAPLLAKFPHLLLQIGERDAAIILRAGGDPREQVCALMIAAVLAQSFGAIVHNQDQDLVCATEQLISDARRSFSALD